MLQKLYAVAPGISVRAFNLQVGQKMVLFFGSVQCRFAKEWQQPRQKWAEVKEITAVSDWTFSTAYWGSAYITGKKSDHQEASIPSSADPGEPTQEPLPFELLQRRDEILWYQELLLWEDELADSGLCRLSARIRVMPEFWFVLLRSEVRIDEVIIRDVATRFFCRTHTAIGSSVGSPEVLREWTWREASYAELRGRGLEMEKSEEISHERVGVTLLGDCDVKRCERHKIHCFFEPQQSL